jgi:3-hydroxyacyl-[acyl-carrier-protein] dehydratase
MDVNEIRDFLPHRYPFLLVDRVTELNIGESILAYKNVTINEPFFNGHFENQPIMPGVLIIEALAQATGLLGFRTMGKEPQDDTLYMLVSVNKVRFKRQVIPGDQLTLHASIKKRRGMMWVFDTKATVDGQLITSAELTCVAKKEEA